MMLAQAASRAPASTWSDLWVWIAILAILLVGLAVLAMALRRRLFGGPNSGTSGFTLHGLDEMRKRGELSEEEYRAARSTIIDATIASSGTARTADKTIRPTANRPDRR